MLTSYLIPPPNCALLQSGRMYYLNRKTLRKSCNWPKDQKLDLELHIATHSNNSCPEQYSSADTLGDSKKNCSPSSNMMALPCLNCHLLVILSKSFPSCPNCKYVHLFPSQQSPPSRAPVVKSLNTLSLLNWLLIKLSRILKNSAKLVSPVVLQVERKCKCMGTVSYINNLFFIEIKSRSLNLGWRWRDNYLRDHDQWCMHTACWILITLQYSKFAFLLHFYFFEQF